MNRFQISICLFLAFCLPDGLNAQTKTGAAAYEPFIPQICKMLEAEQNMIAELNHVSTMMKIDDFMKLKLDDKSIPVPVRESMDKLQKITAEIEEVAKTLPLEKINKMTSELSPADKKGVGAYFARMINKEWSVIKNSWGQGPVGQWLSEGGKDSKNVSTSVNTTPDEINFQQLRKRAASGDRNAKFVLGSRLVRGYGVKQNCAAGIAWLKRASAEGLYEVSFALSRIYEGIPNCQKRDDRLAQKYHALHLEQKDRQKIKANKNNMPAWQENAGYAST